MNLKVRLSSLLRQFGGLEDQPEILEVEASANATSLECLRNLTNRFPSLHKWLYEGEGKLRPVIFVFVNGEKLLLNEISRPLKEGDEVFVVLSFAGG